MEIEVNELRIIIERLLLHLEEMNMASIVIDSDYYWEISKEDRYNPYQEPAHHTLGQLTDDWNELQKLHDPDREPISYDLVWLSAILRSIGEKIVC